MAADQAGPQVGREDGGFVYIFAVHPIQDLPGPQCKLRVTCTQGATQKLQVQLCTGWLVRSGKPALLFTKNDALLRPDREAGG